MRQCLGPRVQTFANGPRYAKKFHDAEEMKKTAPQLADYYKAWLDKYPFVSIEDLAVLSGAKKHDMFISTIVVNCDEL